MNPCTAFLRAFFGAPLDYFPRVPGKSSTVSMSAEEVIEVAKSALESLEPPEDDQKVDHVLRVVRQSLDEVKALTEYQDGKATRLLTILSFLSALAAVLFGRMLDTFPIEDLISRLSFSWSYDLFILFAYLSFAGFAGAKTLTTDRRDQARAGCRNHPSG